MDFHPLITSVPTLSSMMLIVLSLLLFIVAYKVSSKKRNQVGKFFISIIGITALISGLGGVKVFSDAEAIAAPFPIFSLPNTGHTPARMGLTEYLNDPDVSGNKTLVIDRILQIGGGCVGVAPAACSVGLNLPVDASCFIRCTQGEER